MSGSPASIKVPALQLSSSVPPHCSSHQDAQVCKCLNDLLSQVSPVESLAFALSQVVLALASAAAQAQVLLNGAVPYPYAAQGVPVAAPAVLPQDYSVSVGAPVAPVAAPPQVAHSLGLPEARTFVAPPVRQVAEPSIVETHVEPVEQWGYKVAY